MSDYKRLTKQVFNKVQGCEDKMTMHGQSLYDLYNRLAEIEDKIENKTLIELPCKVGDRIWAILGDNIFGRRIKSIVIRSEGYMITTSNTNGWKDLEPYNKEEFGIKWFLTKTEAEKKLEELKQS